MKFLIIMLFSIYLAGCSIERTDRYDLAIQHIVNDPRLLPSVYADNRADSALIFSNDTLKYRVYPEIIDEFFSVFETTILNNFQNTELYDSFFEHENSKGFTIDSSIIDYSNSTDGKIKIFFSQEKSNMISAEVFYRPYNFINKEFDDYKGNSMSNIAAQYLFVFKGEEIDSVYFDVQSYN